MRIVARAEGPDPSAAFKERWPEFIFHDDVSKRHIERVGHYFGRFDILVLDDDGAVMAGGWGVPMAWDGTVEDLPTGYDGALVRAVEGHEAGVRAYAEGLSHVVAPLRPTWKHRYPTVPMAEYATWQRADGLSIAPWIRTHQRMGARILGPAPASMVIEGTVAEWQEWTGMVFPVSRDYVVPEALNLVRVDVERDRGVYVEENLWVEHPRRWLDDGADHHDAEEDDEERQVDRDAAQAQRGNDTAHGREDRLGDAVDARHEAGAETARRGGAGENRAPVEHGAGHEQDLQQQENQAHEGQDQRGYLQ